MFDYISENLKTKHKSELAFPFDDQGFLYGYGLFETIRIENFSPVFLQDHITRLSQSALTLDIPLSYSFSEMESHISDLIFKNNAQQAILNIYLTGGDKTKEESFSFFIILRTWSEKKYNKPLKIDFRQESFQKTALDGYKTMSWIKNVLEMRLSIGFDDVLLFCAEKKVLECTRANAFFVKKNILFTPKSTKILNGVLRNYIIKMANLWGIKVVESDIFVDELVNYEEIFLTNSLRGVILVEKCNGLNHLYSKEVSKKMQKNIIDVYCK